jgi:hypothetical protein
MNNIAGTTNTNDSSANQDQLVLGFLTYYDALEQALVRAGFTQARSTPGSVQADWEMFARHIAERFDPLSKPELIGATSYLLWGEKNQARREKLLKAASPTESARLTEDMVWITEVIRQTGTQAKYGLHFNRSSDFDMGQIVSVMVVLQHWASLDPKLQSLLGFFH